MAIRLKRVPFLLFAVGVTALGITVFLTKGNKKLKSRNMSKMSEEEVLLLVTDKLLHISNFESISTTEEMEGEINELKVMLDFLRDKELAQGTRLNCFFCDLIEMAHDVVELNDALDVKEGKDLVTFLIEVRLIKNWILEAKKYVVQPIADGKDSESANRSENVGKRDDGDVVGSEENVKLLLRRSIFNKEGGLWISFIKGMVGIGKTTLVRQVYNHPAVVDQFECRAWVCVSSELTHKEVIMKLMKQVVDCEEYQRDSLWEKMMHADNRSLQQMLRQRLQGMRYLIVLDGLPKEMRLKCFLKALPNEEKGSRLLLASTSMNLSTPLIIHDVQDIKPLDSDKGWQLFLKTISKYTSEEIFPRQLEKKGKEMLKKCGGLPLAIKDVGMQLARRRLSGSEWEQLLGFINFNATMEFMEFFYQKLDLQLKICFWHLAFFKENATIRADKLIQIWAAGGVGPENLCIAHFVNLACESVFTEKVNDIDYRVKHCRMNAMLHMLCVKKAEERGFEILSNRGIHRPSRSPPNLVIICSREKFSYSMDQDKQIATLFFQGGGCFDASQFYWKCFEILKILDFEDFGLKILPKSIGTLMKLKYLGLRNNYVKELPPSSDTPNKKE